MASCHNTGNYYDIKSFNTEFSNYDAFSGIHINMRSIRNKADELNMLLQSITCKLDILFLTETWLFKTDTAPFIDGYRGMHLMRDEKRGGGVSVYIKDTISFTGIDEFCEITNDVECIALHVRKITMCVIYRPPTGNRETFYTFLERILAHACSRNEYCIIMGDLNIDMNSEVPSLELQTLLSCHGCVNHIILPTRIAPKSATLLDVCISNFSDWDISTGVLAADISDHLPVFFFAKTNFHVNNPPKQPRFSRKINYNTIEHFRQLVDSLDWEIIYRESDVNSAFSVFQQSIRKCYDVAFPLQPESKRTKKVRKPWVDSDLYKRIKKKNSMFHKFIKTKDAETLNAYKKFRNKLQSDLKNAKKEYYEHLFLNIRNQPKKIWDTVNKITSRKVVAQLQFTHLDGEPVGSLEIANRMNNHFIRAGAHPTHTDKSGKCATNIPHLPSSIFLQPTNDTEVRDLIGKINNNAAAGVDGFLSNAIRCVAREISEVLAYIINLCLSTGVFPDDLKVARVTPIYKGGAHDHLSNYRPISVLTVFSKVFEGVIYNRLSTFFLKHNIISKYQYGFQKSKSTEQALLYIKDKIIANIENRQFTIGLFLDLKKAFDSIDHTILLNKLERYGIRGVAGNLLKSYLTKRSQYVEINSISSDILELEQGVPQGSKLGPLLFIVYVNDIINIKGPQELVMYADDTNIFFTSDDIIKLQSMVNAYAKQLANWLFDNKLQLNATKTTYILFRPHNKKVEKEISIVFNGVKLKRVTEQKFLGVWFHEQLSWNRHIAHLSIELSKNIGLIYRIGHLIPLWLKKDLYNALIYSKLCYGILIWGTTTKTNYNRLIILQKRILRIYLNYHGCYANLRTSPLFSEYSMLRADQIYCMKVLHTMYKQKAHKQVDINSSAYQLRHTIRHTPKTRTNYGKQSFTYQSTEILNKIGQKLNFNTSETTFKKQVKEILLKESIGITDV